MPSDLDQNWNFSSWLSAPFLKPLSGQQMYKMMVAIKSNHASGVMECALDNGEVLMLYFKDGRPLDDRQKVQRIVGRDSVVLAWMPHASESINDSTSPNIQLDSEELEINQFVQRAKSLFASFPTLTGTDQWIMLLRQAEVVATSREKFDFVGGGMATGVVAQVNGVFHKVFNDVELSRFSLSCGETRFGYSLLGKGWTVLYRIHQEYQRDVDACINELAQLISSLNDDQSYSMKSKALSMLRTDYGFVRPHFYRRAERFLRQELVDVEQPWSAIWFKYADKVVYAMPAEGESKQEIDGPLEQLFSMIRQAFEPLAGCKADDLVLHARGTTIWCDFFDEGFWATRFDTDDVAYRRVSKDVAARGYWQVQRAFENPMA